MLPFLVFSANIHFHFLALSEVTTAMAFKKYSTIILDCQHATDRLHYHHLILSWSWRWTHNVLLIYCRSFRVKQRVGGKKKKKWEVSCLKKRINKKKSSTPMERKRQTSAKSSILGVKQLQGLLVCVYLHCTSSAFSERRNRKRYC